jgi:hypothetical protein
MLNITPIKIVESLERCAWMLHREKKNIKFEMLCYTWVEEEERARRESAAQSYGILWK